MPDDQELQKILDILRPLGAKSVEWEGQFAKVTFSPGFEKNKSLVEDMDINGYHIEPIWEKAMTLREEIKRKPFVHSVMLAILLVVYGFVLYLVWVMANGDWLHFFEAVAVLTLFVGGFTWLSIWVGNKARNSTRYAYRNMG